MDAQPTKAVTQAKKPSSGRSSSRYDDLIEGTELSELQKDILRRRWADQTSWFGKKARMAKRRMQIFRTVVIIGGVLLPALSTLPEGMTTGIGDWGTPLVSFIVAATAGLEGFFRYSDLYYQYRESAELLKIEGWSFFALSGEYGRYKTHQEAFERFSQRVEDVIRRDVRAVVSQEERQKEKDASTG